MSLINTLNKILGVIALINLGLTVVMSKRNHRSLSVNRLPNIDDQHCTLYTWKNKLQLCVIVIAMVLFLTLIIRVLLNYSNGFNWLIFFIIVPIVTRYIYNLSLSAKTVESNVKGRYKGFSMRDYYAFQALGWSIIGLYKNGLLKNIYLIISMYDNKISSGWLAILFYILSISILIFFICALAVTPLKILVQGGIRILEHISLAKIERCIASMDIFLNIVPKIDPYAATIIERSKKTHNWGRVLLCSLSIPMFFIDIAREMLLLFVGVLIYTAFYLILITGLLVEFFKKVGSWLISLLDSDIIALSFRVAIILGLGCTVIINRYEPIFQHDFYNAGTALLEFISSSLIIPVILDWILSYKKSRSPQSQT